MNLRRHKQHTIAMMLSSNARFWRSIPSALSFDVPATPLVQLFREAAGIVEPQPTPAIVAAVDKLFESVPGMVNVRRKKDGVVTHINISEADALDIIAAAKKAKKASLEIA